MDRHAPQLVERAQHQVGELGQRRVAQDGPRGRQGVLAATALAVLPLLRLRLLLRLLLPLWEDVAEAAAGTSTARAEGPRALLRRGDNGVLRLAGAAL